MLAYINIITNIMNVCFNTIKYTSYNYNFKYCIFYYEYYLFYRDILKKKKKVLSICVSVFFI